MIKFCVCSSFFVAGMGLIASLLTHDVGVLITSMINLTFGLHLMGRLELKVSNDKVRD